MRLFILVITRLDFHLLKSEELTLQSHHCTDDLIHQYLLLHVHIQLGQRRQTLPTTSRGSRGTFCRLRKNLRLHLILQFMSVRITQIRPIQIYPIPATTTPLDSSGNTGIHPHRKIRQIPPQYLKRLSLPWPYLIMLMQIFD